MLKHPLDESLEILPNDATDLPEQTDAELLMQFRQHRREKAFEQLVAKHASMVMRVCGQILRNQHDAEDAFQATFLMLAQQAHKIQRASSVGGWLQRVAYRMAIKIAEKRNRRHELPLFEAESIPTEHWLNITKQEEQTVLYEELSQLPERFRDALTLCYLEGYTRKQAADELECTDATIKSRLANGKRMLRMRLARRGMMLSAAFAVAMVAATDCQAATIPSLVSMTVETCTSTVLHGSTDIYSTRIGSLTQQGVHAMRMTTLSKISLAIGLLLVMGVCWTIYSHAADAQTASEDDVSATLVIKLDGNTEDETEGQATGIIAAPAPNDNPDQTEAGETEFEGVWHWDSFLEAGREERPVAPVMRFKGNRMYFGEYPAYSFSVDPSAMPAQIDLQRGEDVFVRGIYVLDGDSLTICFFKENGETRPDRSESTEDYPTTFFVLRRVPDEEFVLWGGWEAVSKVEGGQEQAVEQGEEGFRINGNTMAIWDHGVAFGCLYSVDPSAMPAQIDLQFGEEEFNRGIYVLDGDSLTICFSNELGEARPDGFESTEENQATVTVFRRITEEESVRTPY